MSSNCGSIWQIRKNKRVQLTNNVPFQATFPIWHALSSTSRILPVQLFSVVRADRLATDKLTQCFSYTWRWLLSCLCITRKNCLRCTFRVNRTRTSTAQIKAPNRSQIWARKRLENAWIRSTERHFVKMPFVAFLHTMLFAFVKHINLWYLCTPRYLRSQTVSRIFLLRHWQVNWQFHWSVKFRLERQAVDF